jgi:hypothetical protein
LTSNVYTLPPIVGLMDKVQNGAIKSVDKLIMNSIN